MSAHEICYITGSTSAVAARVRLVAGVLTCLLTSMPMPVYAYDRAEGEPQGFTTATAAQSGSR